MFGVYSESIETSIYLNYPIRDNPKGGAIHQMEIFSSTETLMLKKVLLKFKGGIEAESFLLKFWFDQNWSILEQRITWFLPVLILIDWLIVWLVGKPENIRSNGAYSSQENIFSI